MTEKETEKERKKKVEWKKIPASSSIRSHLVVEWENRRERESHQVMSKSRRGEANRMEWVRGKKEQEKKRELLPQQLAQHQKFLKHCS